MAVIALMEREFVQTRKLLILPTDQPHEAHRRSQQSHRCQSRRSSCSAVSGGSVPGCDRADPECGGFETVVVFSQDVQLHILSHVRVVDPAARRLRGCRAGAGRVACAARHLSGRLGGGELRRYGLGRVERRQAMDAQANPIIRAVNLKIKRGILPQGFGSRTSRHSA
jgi:hypothetical protein